jgi:hypothetical protein
MARSELELFGVSMLWYLLGLDSDASACLELERLLLSEHRETTLRTLRIMASGEILRKIIWNVDMHATITEKPVSNIVQYNIVAVSTVNMYEHMHYTTHF